MHVTFRKIEFRVVIFFVPRVKFHKGVLGRRFEPRQKMSRPRPVGLKTRLLFSSAERVDFYISIGFRSVELFPDKDG
jgi:hypothetical protein